MCSLMIFRNWTLIRLSRANCGPRISLNEGFTYKLVAPTPHLHHDAFVLLMATGCVETILF